MRPWLTGTFTILLAAIALAGASSAITPLDTSEKETDPSQEHGPVARILHTGTATYTENLERLGWTVIDENGQPTPHLDATFTVKQDQRTLFSTTASSGHDYDAIDRYWLDLPHPGPYHVTVEVPTGTETLTANHTGTIQETPTTNASLQHDLPHEARTGEPLPLEYDIVTEQGERVNHAHVLLEAWDKDDDRRVHQTTTHGHEDPHEATLTFPEEGTYELRLTAYHPYPTERATPFPAFTTTHTIDVTSGSTLTPGAPTRAPIENTVEEGDSDAPFDLFVTFDPYTSTGPDQKIRLGIIIVDPSDRTLVRDIDVNAQITAPDGTLLLETQGHTYDGVVEVETAPPVTGDYTLEIDAQSTRTDWTAHHEATFSIHPPAIPLYAGDYYVALDGPRTVDAGAPAEYTFQATDETGEPYDHSEIAITVTDPADEVHFAGKLHTHDDGLFPFELTFPEAGTFTVHADPFPLMPSPVLEHHGPSSGDDRTFNIEATEPKEIEAIEQQDGAAYTSLVGVFTLLAALVAASALARSKR